MSKFARGFKTHCEEIVTSVREELGLPEQHPINMAKFAQRLEIPLVPFADHVQASGLTCDRVHVEEIYLKISAFTVFEGRRRTVVYNDRHARPRHRSNLAHEFAHALLLHPPEGCAGSSAQERLHEDEAAWLGGVLLLTDRQALAAARLPADLAITQYEISREMLIYRLNVTAASKRARLGGLAA